MSVPMVEVNVHSQISKLVSSFIEQTLFIKDVSITSMSPYIGKFGDILLNVHYSHSSPHIHAVLDVTKVAIDQWLSHYVGLECFEDMYDTMEEYFYLETYL